MGGVGGGKIPMNEGGGAYLCEQRKSMGVIEQSMGVIEQSMGVIEQSIWVI